MLLSCFNSVGRFEGKETSFLVMRTWRHLWKTIPGGNLWHNSPANRRKTLCTLGALTRLLGQLESIE